MTTALTGKLKRKSSRRKSPRQLVDAHSHPIFNMKLSNQIDSIEAISLGQKLKSDIRKIHGPSKLKPLLISVQDDRGRLIGGLRGYSLWGWFYISHLWVAKSQRSKGLGRDLIKKAESEAKKRRCRGVYVDTFGVQTKNFYENLGFKQFGCLADLPRGSSRFYLAKKL